MLRQSFMIQRKIVAAPLRIEVSSWEGNGAESVNSVIASVKK